MSKQKSSGNFPEINQYCYKFIGAAPGSGKTNYIIHERVPLLLSQGYSVMIIVPTINLANQIETNSNGTIKAIHSQSIDGESNVKSEIITAINRVYNTGEPVAIVICEQSYINTLELLQEFEYKLKSWVVIKDEPRDPLNIQQYKISNDVKRIISRFIGDIDTKSRLIATIRPHHAEYDKKDFYLDLDDLDCEVTAKLALFKQVVMNSCTEVLIDRDQLEKNILKYSVFQLPESYSMFAQAIFMKANFEDSFIYHQWQKRGVEWQKIEKEFKQLPSERLRIHYLFDSENCLWSKNFRGKDYQGINNFDKYLSWIRETLPDGNYVYVANNCYSDLDLDLNGTRMTAECHGLNRYSHHTNVVLMGSYLENLSNEPLYAYYESSTTDAVAMRQTQYHVQQITRTDIRNYGSTHPIQVYVPTINEALALLTYLNKATLVHPNGKRLGTLKSEFQSKWSDEPVPANDFAVYGNGVRDSVVKVMDLNGFKPSLKSIMANGNTKNLGHPQLQYVITKRSSISSKGLDKDNNQAQFEKVKESLPYICVGIFNAGDPLNMQHCQGAKMMAFDLDDTTLTDEQLNEVMKGWEYIRYTTFSHEDGKLDANGHPIRRIRVIAPYSRVVTISEHDRIIRYFMDQLFSVMHPGKKMTPEALKASCIDIAKSKPYVKLFVPHAESNIKWVKRDNNRRTVAIDVEDILAQVPPLPKVMLPTVHDILWKSTNDEVTTSISNKDKKLIKKCMTIIDGMHDGHRSNEAVKVGGIMKHIDIQHHPALFDAMRSMGASETALKSAARYASGAYRNKASGGYGLNH